MKMITKLMCKNEYEVMAWFFGLYKNLIGKAAAIYGIAAAFFSALWPVIVTGLEMFVRLIPGDSDGCSSDSEIASLEHIAELKQRAIDLKFALPDGFKDAEIEFLQRCYKGIGPEEWSTVLRKRATAYLNSLEESALVHDFGVATMEKTLANFLILNLQFIRNATFEAKNCKSRKLFWAGLGLGLIALIFGYGKFKKGIQVI